MLSDAGHVLEVGVLSQEAKAPHSSALRNGGVTTPAAPYLSPRHHGTLHAPSWTFLQVSFGARLAMVPMGEGVAQSQVNVGSSPCPHHFQVVRPGATGFLSLSLHVSEQTHRLS